MVKYSTINATHSTSQRQTKQSITVNIHIKGSRLYDFQNHSTLYKQFLEFDTQIEESRKDAPENLELSRNPESKGRKAESMEHTSPLPSLSSCTSHSHY